MKPYKYPYRISFFRFLGKSSKITKNPIPFHKKFFEESGGDSFYLSTFFSNKIMLTRDAKIAKYVMQKNHKLYEKSKIQTFYLSRYLGKGLLTSKGEYWLKQRRLIQPGFHKQKIKGLVDIISRTIDEQTQNIKTDGFVPLHPLMNTLAFEVVAKSLFNYSADGYTLERLQDIIEKLQRFVVKDIREPFKRVFYKLNGEVGKHMKLVKESRTIINAIIEKRRESKETHNDLLDMLINAEYDDGTHMANEQLIDEILILFVAGHETTANALTFTLYLLAKHKEKLKKVKEEVVDLSKTDAVLALTQMPYIKQSIEESMRLYPPAWITDRVALEDDEVGDYYIKKGTLVGISIFEIHRNKAYWDNPEEFIPERFSEENKKDNSQHYFPFGTGPRMCIGNNFAMYEMQLTINAILEKYDIETLNESIDIEPLITLRPVDIQLKFTKN